MSTTKRITVSDSIGKVSAEFTGVDKMKYLMTFAHGAGAGMGHIFMSTMATKLAEMGVGTLRFNFPFTENKKGRPDVPAVAHKTIEAAIAFAKNEYPKVPLYAAGKSFGGRMTSQLFSAHHIEYVRGLVFFGFPLHAPGKPSIDRAAHLATVKTPMLFLQGTRDSLAEWDLIEKVCGGLKTAKLVRFEGADHSFKVPRKDILPELAATVKNWMSDH